MSDMRVYSGQETPSADIEMQDIKMEAEIIVEPHVPNALRRARRAQILFEWTQLVAQVVPESHNQLFLNK